MTTRLVSTTTEPLTIEELKRQCRVDDDNTDGIAILGQLLEGAIAAREGKLDAALAVVRKAAAQDDSLPFAFGPPQPGDIRHSAMTPERLKPEWILEWLKNPGQIQPGTRMPQFWPTPPYPKSSFPGLGEDAETQIRAIRDHLMTLRGGPSPKRPAGAATSTN